MNSKNLLLFFFTGALAFSAVAQNSPEGDTIYTAIDKKKDYYSVQILYSDSSVRESGYMLNGKKTGDWIYNYPNGVILSFSQYENGEKNGIYFECEKSGAIVVQEYYKNGVLDGEQKKYTSSKNVRIIKSIAHYKNGSLEGKLIEYNEMGTPQTESAYTAGKKNGTSKWYFSNNRIAMEQNYQNDVLEGKQTIFNREGTVTSQGNFKNNMKEGIWIEYYDSGTLKSQGTYIDDRQTGEWKYFDENGVLTKTEKH